MDGVDKLEAEGGSRAGDGGQGRAGVAGAGIGGVFGRKRFAACFRVAGGVTIDAALPISPLKKRLGLDNMKVGHS